MARYVMYKTLNGEITLVYMGEAPELNLLVGESFLEVDSSESVTNKYVAGELLVDRPVMPVSVDKLTCVADGVDSINLTGIPAGVQLTLDNLSEVVTVGSVSVAFDIVGDHKLTLELFPYITYEATLHAT